MSQKTSWSGRPAYRLQNEQVELITLTGGGHIAAFQFRDASGRPTVNPLWVAPWKTIDPQRFHPQRHVRLYGTPLVGRFLSGYTGHSLALDYFGAPSEEEARLGLSIHGEAPCLPWTRRSHSVSAREACLSLGVRLPAAGLQFERELRIRRGESVVYIVETAENKRALDHFFQWTQHVTLGLPFLAPGESQVFLPATQAKTWPLGYEGKNLLADDKEFLWPWAPGRHRGERIDLSRPFPRRGTGFVSAALIDPRRERGYVAALNRSLGLLVGYCFRREDYPWVAVWEENRARTYSPWNRRTQARGLEFGTTPMPLGRAETFLAGPLFGVPRLTRVPARRQKQVSYLVFLTQIPPNWGIVRDIVLEKKFIVLLGSARKGVLRLPAAGLGSLGLA